MKIKSKYTYFFLLILLLLPFIQESLSLFKLEPLTGAISSPELTKFQKQEWIEGTYQQKKDEENNQTFGFRSTFIRVHNQINFSLFKKVSAKGVIVGLNNCLYEENYITAWNGSDYLGDEKIDSLSTKLTFINQALKRQGKQLLILLAPGKGTFYPEYIPMKYRISTSKKTNYKEIANDLQEKGLNYIDFNKYFKDLKPKSPYILYPMHGIHWSGYGMCLAIDTILKRIEQIRGTKINKCYWDTIKFDKPRYSDNDIETGLNLLLSLNKEKLAYPNIKYQNSSDAEKPSILTIGDSFYWGLLNLHFQDPFSKSSFWYYNREAYESGSSSVIDVAQIDLQKKINETDIIIIISTDANLPKLGWGFIDNLYNLLSGKNSAFTKDQINSVINSIRTDQKWMEQIKDKAKQRNITIDSMLVLDAIWMLKH